MQSTLLFRGYRACPSDASAPLREEVVQSHTKQNVAYWVCSVCRFYNAEELCWDFHNAVFAVAHITPACVTALTLALRAHIASRIPTLGHCRCSKEHRAQVSSSTLSLSLSLPH